MTKIKRPSPQTETETDCEEFHLRCYMHFVLRVCIYMFHFTCFITCKFVLHTFHFAYISFCIFAYARSTDAWDSDSSPPPLAVVTGGKHVCACEGVGVCVGLGVGVGVGVGVGDTS